MSEIIYISGPMTGLPDFNYPAFHAKAAELEARGAVVRNPATIDGSDSWAWGQWMREALRLQLDADAIHMLPGWRQSRGAVVEYELAQVLGQRIEGADQ